jgi:two-component system, LytTR family, response regulator LytT
MTVLIVENESLAARRLGSLVVKALGDRPHILQYTTSVAETISYLQINSCDLIFLDIHLGDGLSFNIFDKITISTPIIFTTAYDNYAIKAFKLNSVDYLLKPIDEEHLDAALKKFFDLYDKQNAAQVVDFSQLIKSIKGFNTSIQFFSKRGDKTVLIKLKDIVYFYAQDGYTHCCTLFNQRSILEETLDQIEEKLDNSIYFRINRSMILQKEAISSFEPYFNQRLVLSIEPSHTDSVIVARERVKEFKLWLKE